MRVRSLLKLMLAICAIAVGACGSTAKPSGSATSGATAAVKFADCMRANGVPYSGPGGSLDLRIPNTLLQSPAFTRAATACGFPLPGAAKRATTG